MDFGFVSWTPFLVGFYLRLVQLGLMYPGVDDLRLLLDIGYLGVKLSLAELVEVLDGVFDRL